MNSKILFSFIVFSIVSSLLFQNCSKLTALAKFDESVAVATQDPLKFSSLYSENNGEGYLGKPEVIDYVKSFQNYECQSALQSNAAKNVQGVAIYDGFKIVVSNDNCMDLNLVISASDKQIDIQPYNQEMLMLASVPYEKRSTFADNSFRATEVFCRDISESSGMDILIKYDDVATSSVKIFMGVKNEDEKWTLSSVDYFSVKKSSSPRVFSSEAFKLSLTRDESSKINYSAALEMTLDEKKIIKNISCYAMNMNPTIASVGDPTMVAHWAFNNNLEEFVNNLTSISVDSDQSFGFSEGHFGQAAHFDGNDDRVQVAPNPEINDMPALTTAMWVWPNFSGGLVRKAGGGSGGEDSGWIFGIDHQSRQLLFKAIFVDGFIEVRSADAGLIPLAWNHVALTWDGTNSPESVSLYVNGELVVKTTQLTATSNQRPTDVNDPLLIGDRPAPETPRFKGSLDQLIIWNRALQYKEIRYLFRNGVPN